MFSPLKYFKNLQEIWSKGEENVNTLFYNSYNILTFVLLEFHPRTDVSFLLTTLTYEIKKHCNLDIAAKVSQISSGMSGNRFLYYFHPNHFLSCNESRTIWVTNYCKKLSSNVTYFLYFGISEVVVWNVHRVFSFSMWCMNCPLITSLWYWSSLLLFYYTRAILPLDSFSLCSRDS